MSPNILISPNASSPFSDITPSPSVYRLTSEDDKNLEMCLITDYSPEKLKSIRSNVNKTETVVEVATSENKYEASYLSTYWAKKGEMECGAMHEGLEVRSDDPEAGNVGCVFRAIRGLSAISMNRTCSHLLTL